MAQLVTLKKANLKGKIIAIGYLFFDNLGPVEMDLLLELLKMTKGAPINITPMVSETISEALSLNKSTFSVSMSRLNKKRAIKKNKSIVNFHPILNTILKNDEFLIRFEE